MTDDVGELYALARNFFDTEVGTNRERWADQQCVDRDFWLKAGELGLLCTSIPEQYGGGGGTFLHYAAVQEAYGATGDRSWGNTVHSGVVAHYILSYGTEEQKKRWLPKLSSGEFVGAIAMTEPSAGSDLKAMKTRAVLKNDEWVINGSKTFITNGSSADLIVIACRTDPNLGTKGLSLIVLESAEAEGFVRGKVLNKIGQHGADTSELSFNNVRVPSSNLLGEPGAGFAMMMDQLPQERLIVGITAVTAIELAVRETVAYAKQRELFGGPLINMQNTRFQLAECATLATVSRTFLDDCIKKHVSDGIDPATAAMCKWWLTDVQGQVVDACLQLHGGYGFMTEYPIARLFVDARAQRIYGGSNEVQKELIARSL